MQKHQLETISNEAQKTALQIFGATKGIRPQILDAISSDRSCTHPFWRAPHSLSMARNSAVTQRLELIKLRSHHSMFRDTAGTQSLGIMSKLVRTDCERFVCAVPGVCQTSCPPISCGVSDFRVAGYGFWVEPDGSGGLPVAGFA
jgi:hypothetical protein